MAGFIDEFFLNPIRYPTQYAPYNVYNTLTYALIALVAVYLLFRLFSRMKIKVDSKFYYAILPFVVFGSVLRVTEDGSILPRTIYFGGAELHPFVTPGIYVLVFLALVGTFLVLKAFKTPEKKLPQRLALAGGTLAALAFLWLVKQLGGRVGAQQVSYVVYTVLLAAIPVIAFELIKKFYNKRAKPELRHMEWTTVASQALDGAATFVGVSLAGYREQHIVANTVFEVFGTPLAFYALKMLFVLAVIFVLRRESAKSEEHTYLLLLVTILGLGPGLRDTLRVFFGV